MIVWKLQTTCRSLVNNSERCWTFPEMLNCEDFSLLVLMRGETFHNIGTWLHACRTGPELGGDWHSTGHVDSGAAELRLSMFWMLCWCLGSKPWLGPWLGATTQYKRHHPAINCWRCCLSSSVLGQSDKHTRVLKLSKLRLNMRKMRSKSISSPSMHSSEVP